MNRIAWSYKTASTIYYAKVDNDSVQALLRSLTADENLASLSLINCYGDKITYRS